MIDLALDLVQVLVVGLVNFKWGISTSLIVELLQLLQILGFRIDFLSLLELLALGVLEDGDNVFGFVGGDWRRVHGHIRGEHPPLTPTSEGLTHRTMEHLFIIIIVNN